MSNEDIINFLIFFFFKDIRKLIIFQINLNNLETKLRKGNIFYFTES